MTLPRALLALPALPALLAVLLAGACASGPQTRTLQLRAFLGAAEDGSWAYAEVNAFPGSPATGKVHVVGPNARVRSSSDLPATALADSLARAAEAGAAARRTAEKALWALRPEGFDLSRAAPVPVTIGGARQGLPLPIPAELDLRREDDEVRLLVRLAGGDEELAAYRLPVAGTTWIEAVHVLPGNRTALALTGSATASGSDLYRLEGLGEVDLAGAVAALLDSRAVRRIATGALDQATADLKQATALAPDDATSHYNLACAHALADELDEAILALGRAVDLDPDRLKPLALSDPDLAALHSRVEFRLMVEPRTPGAGP